MAERRLECPHCRLTLGRLTSQPRTSGEPEVVIASGVRHGITLTANGPRDALYCPRCKRWRALAADYRVMPC